MNLDYKEHWHLVYILPTRKHRGEHSREWGVTGHTLVYSLMPILAFLAVPEAFLLLVSVSEQPTRSSRRRLSTHPNLISTAGFLIVFSSLDTRKSIGEGWRRDWLLNQELCRVAETSLHSDTSILQSHNRIPVTLGALLLRPPQFVCFCTQFFKSSLWNTRL